jgi:3'-phosphoadenosine 5'-phosphosulfate (PAPS) 3'-phosphatase
MNDISVQLEDLLGAARRLAVDAGDQIMEIYNNHDLDVTAKDDKSPLTAADLAAHQIIKNGLGRSRRNSRFCPRSPTNCPLIRARVGQPIG